MRLNLELISNAQCDVEIKAIIKIPITYNSDFRSKIEGNKQGHIEIAFNADISGGKNKSSAVPV